MEYVTKRIKIDVTMSEPLGAGQVMTDKEIALRLEMLIIDSGSSDGKYTFHSVTVEDEQSTPNQIER